MLSDNIRAYRKKINLSQDELAEKIGVSRQSVSFWENGQTQPTIDNIIALARIFNISTDVLLDNGDLAEMHKNESQENAPPKKKGKAWLIITICMLITAAIIFCAVIILLSPKGNTSDGSNPSNTAGSNLGSSTPDPTENFDLFTYCKNFAIEHGELNGDYCMYQQPATRYGGFDNEYFSISYWTDSDMVEFCLHCPLDETLSHNFYLRMRGGYDGQYEYVSSKYYRDNGESLRYAMGHIDPSVFSDSYPIPCEVYEGKADGQTEFMEQSRVGICDLIECLENFVIIEKMECDFSAFGFKNF